MPNVELPLPGDVSGAFSSFLSLEPHECHPGLRLDKYCWRSDHQNQERQKAELDQICRCTPSVGVARESALRQTALQQLGALQWQQTTAGPLTLHLARTSPLENAGIALHPVYGFVYLPGTGLKGLTHAWAETIWLPQQSEPDAAKRSIARIFGFAADDQNGESAAGAVVFHDAWPLEWPKLIVDVLNSHHSKYYQGQEPPVEWEDTNPVYFLAIGPGTKFGFAVTARRQTDGSADLGLAAEWLKDSLVHLGAGAKTASGYGRFKPAAGRTRVAQLGTRLQREYTLRLDTPAFLAGASQQSEDCCLRTATLRGQLRYWWRTMHSGRLSNPDLLALESRIWGDTKASALVALELEPLGPEVPSRFDPDQIAPQAGIGRPQGRFGYGFAYTAYGMKEKQRQWIAPGLKYTVRFMARSTPRESAVEPRVSADQAMEQAQLSLRLLCRFGGAGSKARKGYGGLALCSDVDDDSALLQTCVDRATALRGALGLRCPAGPLRTDSPSLEEVIRYWWDIPQKNAWQALDMVGFAARVFAGDIMKHNPQKVGLGLPRSINKNPAIPLHGARGVKRHPSPVHYSIRQTDEGFRVRFAAFPSNVLPDAPTNRELLQQLLNKFHEGMEKLKVERPEGKRTAPPAQSAPLPRPPAPPLTVGEEVAGVLVEQNRKGTWTAKAKGISGPVTNKLDLPASLTQGTKVILRVSAVTPNPSFRYLRQGEA